MVIATVLYNLPLIGVFYIDTKERRRSYLYNLIQVYERGLR